MNTFCSWEIIKNNIINDEDGDDLIVQMDVKILLKDLAAILCCDRVERR
jgi:hypothetical protein